MESRLYKFVDTTSPNIEDTKMLCMGGNKRCKLDETILFVKTKQSMIDKYIADNPGITEDLLFPPALTTDATEEEAKTELAKPEWTLPFDQY